MDKIREYLKELGGRLPTLEESNKWGGMKDQSGKVVGWKLFANAVIAFQNIEILKERLKKDVEEGLPRTVNRIRKILENIQVYDRLENIPDSSANAGSSSHKPEVTAASADLVSLALQAQKGYKNICLVVASDAKNVNGSPFDGPQNTVDESMSYCAPELTLISILAALGHAYPNPGTMFIPGIKIERKAKAKEDSKSRFESTVYENLSEPFEVNFIFSPAFDLRIPLKENGTFQKAETKVNEEKEAKIKESKEYQDTPEDGKKVFLLEKMNEFKNDRSENGFLKLFDKEKLLLRDAYLAVSENLENYRTNLLFPPIRLICEVARHGSADHIIFPGWGTGVYMNPPEEVYRALQVGISEGGSSIHKVVLSTFSPEQEAAYKKVFLTETK